MNIKAIWTAGFLVVFLAISSPSAFAHGVTHDRLEAVNHDISHCPDDPVLYVKRGRVHADAEHWDEALKDYETALKIDPDYHETRFWQGDVLIRMGKYQRARATLQIYLKHLPESPSGNRAMGQVMLKLAEFTKAADYYDRAIESDANPPPQLYLERARALMQARPLPEKRILAGLAAGLVRHPFNVPIIEQLVNVNVSLEAYTQAIVAMNSLPAVVQDLPNWIIRRAKIEALRGHRTAALRLYKRALERLEAMPEKRKRLPAFAKARHLAERGITSL